MQVLRTTFFLLVLGNLLLYTWGQGYLGQPAGGESERFAAQLDPGKLRFHNIEPPSARAAEPSRTVCRALSGLEHEAALKLIEMLAARDAQLDVTRRPAGEPKSWWVYIPPSPSFSQAEKKAADLARLRVKDFFIVREAGPDQHAISLGLFKSEESAKKQIEMLQKKNVKSARILARETPGDKSIVEVRGAPERLARALAELPPELNASPATDCPAARP